MFIQTEETPNPDTLKFLPGRVLVEGEAVDCQTAEEARIRAPLAAALFEVDGVLSVMIGREFVAVSKQKDVEWYLLKPALLGCLMEHLVTNRPILAENAAPLSADETKPPVREEDMETVRQIQVLLDERVRPFVAQDGGDIVFHAFQEGVVYLTMRGACAGCPSSTATLKMGIENLLKHYLPDVREVRAVEAL